MKIEKLTLKNFLSSQHSVFEFPNTTTLICGRNGSGKTAIHDALRVVLVDKAPDARGINTKSGLKALISKGAKDGYVEVEVAIGLDPVKDLESYRRSLKTGNYGPFQPEINPYLPFLLHTKQFGSLPAGDRRGFLIELGGVSVNKGAVIKELKTRKCSDWMIDEIAPLLLGGFEGAQQHAQGKAREAKGRWSGVTDETWGAVKAETWYSKADALPADYAVQMAAVEREIDRLTLTAAGGILPLYRGGLTAPCPHCGESITYGQGKFSKAVEPSTLEQRGVEQAQKVGLDKLEQDKKLRLADEKIKLANSQEKRRAFELQKFEADHKEQKTTYAAEVHQTILGWLDLAKELSPEGVPRLVFDRAIRPINLRLAGWSNFFPMICIDSYGEITFDGRVYELLSESQQWLCDAMIAEAIAYHSDLRLLLLDRMDVLDVPNRWVFVKWMEEIQGDYDTIIVTATMKRAPELKFCDSLWIENGRVVESP